MIEMIESTTGHWTSADVKYLNHLAFINQMDKRPRIRTKEEFILEIRKLSQIDKKYLNYAYLREIKRNDLLWESAKYFGGWRGAVQASGFRPIQKGWTKQEISNTIKKIVS